MQYKAMQTHHKLSNHKLSSSFLKEVDTSSCLPFPPTAHTLHIINTRLVACTCSGCEHTQQARTADIPDNWRFLGPVDREGPQSLLNSERAILKMISERQRAR